MQVCLPYGREQLHLEVQENKLVPSPGSPATPALANPADAIRQALENPIGFPALRRALTPDDHVAIVVDEQLLGLPGLLLPVLEHLALARVSTEAITLVSKPTDSPVSWREGLRSQFQKLRHEIHDPSERRRLSYLATTKRGRRIYLNRTVVDADQIVVLAARAYDPLLGYAGSEGAIFPALSDESTLKEWNGTLSMNPPGEKPWPARQEAAEVAWLLGAPFMVQVICGSGAEILHVLGGLVESGEEGIRLLDNRWRMTVGATAETVVAGICGNPGEHSFADLAAALASASRVVEPRGRIVLLCQARPELYQAAELLRQAETPEEALELLRSHNPAGRAAAFQWASAAQRATIYLLCDLPLDAAEELFATPLEDAQQVQRLVNSAGSCLFLPDAHRTMAVASRTD
jgi:nickel-dependent lactate racemase